MGKAVIMAKRMKVRRCVCKPGRSGVTRAYFNAVIGMKAAEYDAQVYERRGQEKRAAERWKDARYEGNYAENLYSELTKGEHAEARKCMKKYREGCMILWKGK